MRNHWIYIIIGFIAGAGLFLTTAWQRTPPAEQVSVKLEKTDRLPAPAVQTSFAMERFGPARTVE
ncbi:hypothetical protein PYH37_004456 [Sinorhizobium numidicum]|uniref:Transmembrane protein n=1 Tax=Sinorhizobium numidicum TaxID=680248 RepID=A0ABY8CW15_9HYPH|nr:hypothetical protein [Sinorhizobium numidicum]WEX76176.1 hypothetical protein PYH37_004456 [Sinorhizobium numidicum]WEX82835.1 hypothetical protein PYH38_005168 [Sinorhizobium numidicum]